MTTLPFHRGAPASASGPAHHSPFAMTDYTLIYKGFNSWPMYHRVDAFQQPEHTGVLWELVSLPCNAS